MTSSPLKLDLDFFKKRALTSCPDLSELQPSVLENLTARAEALEPSARLKLYKDIIFRRHLIKQHEEAIENLVIDPKFSNNKMSI